MAALHFPDFAGESACTRSGDVITLSGTKMTNSRTFANAMADASIDFDDGDTVAVGVVDGSGNSAVWWATYANGAGTITKVTEKAAQGTLGTTGLYVYAVPSGAVLGDLEHVRAALPGTTFPVAADFPGGVIPDGTTFYHQTHKISFIYEQDWIADKGFDDLTLYVDKTNGADTPGKGFGATTDAAATVAWLWANVVPIYTNGDIVINLTGEDYTSEGALSFDGKTLGPGKSITIVGALSSSSTGTASSFTAGTGATQGTVTDTGAFGSYDDKLIHSTELDEYRLIDSDTADVATIVGCWSSVPTSKAYTIYDWATSIRIERIFSGLSEVIFQDLKLDQDAVSNNIDVASADLTFTRCWFYSTNDKSIRSNISSFITMERCFFEAFGFIVKQSKGELHGCKISKSTTNCVSLNAMGYLLLTKGSILNGSAASGTGLNASGNAVCLCYSAPSDGYPRIRNLATGISAATGGNVTFTSTNQYSGNTSDEAATAASYGYID